MATKSVPWALGAALALLSVSCIGSTKPQKPLPESAGVTASSLRAEISRYVCAAWLEDYQVYEARFNDPRCAHGRTLAAGDLADVGVLRAVHDCADLVVLGGSAYTDAYTQLEDPGARTQAQLDAVVREAYWKDRYLGPAMLSRSMHYLEQLGVKCGDCPSTGTPLQVTLTWAEFKPYLLAHIWPVRDSDTQTTHIFVCGATNGVEALGLTNSAALDAGFLAAVALTENEETRASIAEIAERRLDLDPAAAAIADFIDTLAVTEVVCSSVQSNSWFTGIVVTSCQSIPK